MFSFNTHLKLILKNINNLATLLNAIFSKSCTEYQCIILYIVKTWCLNSYYSLFLFFNIFYFHKIVCNFSIYHFSFYESDYCKNAYSFVYFGTHWPVNNYDLTHKPSYEIQGARATLVITIFTDRLHQPDTQPVCPGPQIMQQVKLTDLKLPPWPFLKHIRNTPVVMTPPHSGCAAHASVCVLFCLSNGAATTGAIPLRHCRG